MAIFDRLDRAISRACDRQFSVRATIDCKVKRPNGRPSPDPERGEIHVEGIFDRYDAYAQVEIGSRDGRGNDLKSQISGSNYQFSIDAHRYPSARHVLQGDQLTLDDARKFTVVSVQPDGMVRLVLVLSRI